MDTKNSIRQQKTYGTYNRNKLIRLRCEAGVSQSVVARLEGISRQRVWQILHKEKLNWLQRLMLFLGG